MAIPVLSEVEFRKETVFKDNVNIEKNIIIDEEYDIYLKWYEINYATTNPTDRIDTTSAEQENYFKRIGLEGKAWYQNGDNKFNYSITWPSLQELVLLEHSFIFYTKEYTVSGFNFISNKEEEHYINTINFALLEGQEVEPFGIYFFATPVLGAKLYGVNGSLDILNTKILNNTNSIATNTEDIAINTEDIIKLQSRLNDLGFNGGNIITGTDYDSKENYNLGYVAKMGKIIYGFLHFPTSLNTNATTIDVEQLLSGNGAKLIQDYPPGKDIGFCYNPLVGVFGHITAAGDITLNEDGDLNSTSKKTILLNDSYYYWFWYVIDSQFEPNES